MTVDQVNAATCRGFVTARATPAGARRDLELLRAALRHYHAEHGLSTLPRVTLPARGMPRQATLSRDEAARLLRAARRIPRARFHLVRLILIGLYTGTRLQAMLDLRWIPNTCGGWIDLERGIIYRAGTDQRIMHNKRRPPVRIAARLARLLRFWKAADMRAGLSAETPVIHWRGAPVTKPHKAFRTARRLAGLDESVTPHVLRHSCGTWLVEAGVNTAAAASFMGLTTDEFERTYLHLSPGFQDEAIGALERSANTDRNRTDTRQRK
jgi:integrase